MIKIKEVEVGSKCNWCKKGYMVKQNIVSHNAAYLGIAYFLRCSERKTCSCAENVYRKENRREGDE